MDFDVSFFQKEIRDGFLVSEKRKKVWAVELRMLQRLDEVCKKYHLTYYACYGTLLGAARHSGFIPWDDDIDVVMFRDDYERFQSVASQEFTEPYFFQNSYTDLKIWPFSKIRDNRTTGIEFRDLKDFHQGIFMDIFPLDNVPDGINEEFDSIQEMEKLLWSTVVNPYGVLAKLKEELRMGKRAVSDIEVLLGVVKEPDPRVKFRLFEEFNLSHFGETEEVNYIMEEIRPSNYKSLKTEWFHEVVYLPFENIMIPAPAQYGEVLTRCYGDWKQFVQGGGCHKNIILDPDIPYREYFAYYL